MYRDLDSLESRSRFCDYDIEPSCLIKSAKLVDSFSRAGRLIFLILFMSNLVGYVNLQKFYNLM